jgi:hypothetical protein
LEPIDKKIQEITFGANRRDLPSSFALPDFAFGYDLVNDDYKVLKIMKYFNCVESLHPIKKGL